MAAQKALAKKETFQVRPDSKGRVPLGKRAEGVSSYVVHEETNGRLVFEPRIEIPAREAWLFQNKTALASVKRGLEQSAEGKTQSLGSFAKFADDELDD